MSQHYSSLFNIYSKNCSRLNLQSILSSSNVITISVGVYFYNHHAGYKKLKDLPFFFTKEIDSIISTDSKAFCIHNGYTSVIYLFSDCEAQNLELLNEVFIWITKLQTTLKTVRFCIGIDGRAIENTKDIILSEIMAHFRMFKNIHDIINQERVIMDKSISIIDKMKNYLNNVIVFNDYNLNSEDAIEISQCLDKLINMYMYCTAKEMSR